MESSAQDATASTNPSKTGPTLQNLGTDILLMISKSLDPASSVCLSLTCKDIYSVHLLSHGLVPLGMGSDGRAIDTTGVELGHLLELGGWLPKHLTYDMDTELFMSRKALAERIRRQRQHVEIKNRINQRISR